MKEEKAMLILDMPSDCRHCQLLNIGEEHLFCMGVVRKSGMFERVTDLEEWKRPDWCPLAKI